MGKNNFKLIKNENLINENENSKLKDNSKNKMIINSEDDFTYEDYMNLVKSKEFYLGKADLKAIEALLIEGLNYKQVTETIETRYEFIWSYKTTFIFLMHNDDEEFLNKFDEFLDTNEPLPEEIERWIHENKNEQCILHPIWDNFKDTYMEEEEEYSN